MYMLLINNYLYNFPFSRFRRTEKCDTYLYYSYNLQSFPMLSEANESTFKKF